MECIIYRFRGGRLVPRGVQGGTAGEEGEDKYAAAIATMRAHYKSSNGMVHSYNDVEINQRISR